MANDKLDPKRDMQIEADGKLDREAPGAGVTPAHTEAASSGAKMAEVGKAANLLSTLAGSKSGPLPTVPGPPSADVEVSGDVVGEAEKTHLEVLHTTLVEQEIKLQDATNVVSTLRRERGRLLAREERTRSALEALELRQIGLAEARDSLREWTGVRSPSFTWKLLQRLVSERASATDELRIRHDETTKPWGSELPTPAQLQDVFMKRVISGFGVAAALLVLVLALKSFVPVLAAARVNVNPFCWTWWVLVLVALGAFIVWWLACLLTFYRENSVRRQELRYASSYLDYLAISGLKVREEMQRLDALHAQVPEYLQYLSEVLHRPWDQPAVPRGVEPGSEETDGVVESPESLVFDTRRPSAEHLPSFMRLAVCPLDAGSMAEANLVRDTVRALVHRGWRFEALAALLRAVEQAESLPMDAFAPARLDRDQRLRVALLQSLNTSDARLRAGRGQLRGMALQIQLTAMDKHQPPVRDIATNPLGGLRLDDDLLGSANRQLKEWDDFLSEALMDGGSWSPPAFSLEGRISVNDVWAVASGPERLKASHAPSVTYTSLEEPSVRPIELVIRVDRTSAGLGPNNFLVFDGGEATDPELSELSFHRSDVPLVDVSAESGSEFPHSESLA